MNKKLCTLFDDGDAYYMLLSDDQIAIIGWLSDKCGYSLSVDIHEEPLEINYDDWSKKAIRR